MIRKLDKPKDCKDDKGRNDHKIHESRQCVADFFHVKSKLIENDAPQKTVRNVAQEMNLQARSPRTRKPPPGQLPAAEFEWLGPRHDQIARVQFRGPPKQHCHKHQAHHRPNDVQKMQTKQQACQQNHQGCAEGILEPSVRRQAKIQVVQVPVGKRRRSARQVRDKRKRDNQVKGERQAKEGGDNCTWVQVSGKGQLRRRRASFVGCGNYRKHGDSELAARHQQRHEHASEVGRGAREIEREQQLCERFVGNIVDARPRAQRIVHSTCFLLLLVLLFE